MDEENQDSEFIFKISLSVLDHLGRRLYRNFVTVLGEAISNSWDAGANNVWIEIDRTNRTLLIKDDGHGMTHDDFQNKFLKVGYTKRTDPTTVRTERPFIGRKGIGKLALLSCADSVTVITKTSSTDYVGGVIDNNGLEDAIDQDLTPQDYPLGEFNFADFQDYTNGHSKGTILYFEGLKDGVINTEEHLKKVVALYFRFSLIDPAFNVYINGDIVNEESLSELINSTEFLWKINQIDDPYIQKLEEVFSDEENEVEQINVDNRISGFIASVEFPRNLKILGTGEKVSVDLFVNGRLRERDLLRHIPSARIVESYLYGQIHFNDLDDDEDRFTTARESVVADDPKLKDLLQILNDQIMKKILKQWDKWRLDHNEDGDDENTENAKPRDRKSAGLFNVVAKDYKEDDDSEQGRKVNSWVKSLGGDAQFNFGSYADCFVSENLIRKLIEDQQIALSPEAIRDIAGWKRLESQNKTNGNVSIDTRKDNSDLSYLDMAGLATLVDNNPGQSTGLPRDAKQYRPIRDSLMHTALLSEPAKRMLGTTFENIKARVKSLLQSSGSEDS